MIRCTANGIETTGEGGLINVDQMDFISLEQNYLTQITSSSYGAIMQGTNCRNTTIRQNCMVKTYTTASAGGQTFRITEQTEEIEFEDNTVVKCPEDMDINRYTISWFLKPSDLQIKQNNFSFCKISQSTIIGVSSSNPINILMNTFANDTAAIVYFMNSQICTLSCENIVEIDHVENNYGLFYQSASGSSITDSLFISVRQQNLEFSGSITINSCLFYNCSFSSSTNIATASTLPFTNTNTHFGSYECITPDRKTKGFTNQFYFNLKAFLAHFIIA